MRIDDKENIILAYFNMNKNDYVLYTIDDGIPEIYLSKVIYKPKEIDFEIVDKKENKNLKMIISEFLVNNHNYAFLRKVGYNSLSLDQLKANIIHKKGFQMIHLTNNQYDVFANNEKLKRVREKKHYSIYIIIITFFIISVFLLLYFLGIIKF